MPLLIALLVAALSVVFGAVVGPPLGRAVVDNWRATLSWLLAGVGGALLFWHLGR
jgi:hypothetical protein